MMPAPGEPTDTPAPSRRDAALAYAARGWPVVPLHWPVGDGCSCGKADCKSIGKHPRTEHGLKDATVDLAKVNAYWQRWPLANVGVTTGAPSGFIAIDVDAGGDATLADLEAEHGALPTTLQAATGNGRHILFDPPAGVQIRNDAKRRLGAGLDVRGDGGYIVAPPSAHASGRTYRWLNEETPIAAMPAWLLERVRKADPPPRPAPAPARSPRPGDGTAYGLKALDDELGQLRQAPQGTRNASLNTAAFRMGQLVGGDELAEGHVENVLLAIADEWPDFTEREARNTVRSGLDSGVKQPRQAPESFRGRHLAAVSPAPRPQPKEPASPSDSAASLGTLARPGFRLTDLGNAERLVDLHGSRIRFCHPWSTWLVWDGRRWARDRTGRVTQLATETVRLIYAEASATAEEQERKAIADWAKRSEANVRIRAMLDLAESRPGVPVLPEELDVNPWLLNCRNGIVDLRTGELREHDPAELLTKLAPVDFDPAATCELLDMVLHDATGGDAELGTFIQRAAGYTLVGNTAEEVLFLIHGPAAAGKSTFLEALKAALGDYALTLDFESLLPRSSVGGARNDIARLAGARFVCSIEVDQGKRLAESLVKTLTGGDTITARRLYQEAFEFRPSHTLWLAANHAPTVRDDDEAMWRRILRVPFEHPIPGDQRDPQVKALLQDPGYGGAAILAWAVKGCLSWQARGGLDVPNSVRVATQAYRDDMDPLGPWLEDRCVIDSGCWTAFATLRRDYESWATENGEAHTVHRRRFTEGLKAHGAIPKAGYAAGKSDRGWQGVGLRADARFAQQEMESPS